MSKNKVCWKYKEVLRRFSVGICKNIVYILYTFIRCPDLSLQLSRTFLIRTIVSQEGHFRFSLVKYVSYKILSVSYKASPAPIAMVTVVTQLSASWTPKTCTSYATSTCWTSRRLLSWMVEIWSFTRASVKVNCLIYHCHPYIARMLFMGTPLKSKSECAR